MPHRQYEAWTSWLKRQWNEPSRADHYLMQIACIVENLFVKKQNTDLQKYKVKFGSTKVSKRTVEESKRRALRELGIERN